MKIIMIIYCQNKNLFLDKPTQNSKLKKKMIYGAQTATIK